MDAKIMGIYTDGTYVNNNPSWHVADSPWKATNIRKIIERNALKASTVCEIGCGAGEILSQLSSHYRDKIYFYGYEISPQAFQFCEGKARPNLEFKLADLFDDENAYFDIAMAIDVIEHIEDYFSFLRKLRSKATYKIFHIPLDLSCQTVARSTPIMKHRKSVGHIHYFTKETALETLRDTGYDIIDFFYTAGSLDLPSRNWKSWLLKIPRRLAFSANQDVAVRILGGYSLMVLAN